MQIISHRGYWLQPDEKNSVAAFKRSFELGFGVETDIRDRDGELVISHDPPKENALAFREFLEMHASLCPDSLLALNVKADGLNLLAERALQEYGVRNYFFFDMSIPDSLPYLKRNQKLFTRQSEYEPVPAFYEDAAGVWLDSFREARINLETIKDHVNRGKSVAIVSDELHGRNPAQQWRDLAAFLPSINHDGIILCTDFPEKAQREFAQ